MFWSQNFLGVDAISSIVETGELKKCSCLIILAIILWSYLNLIGWSPEERNFKYQVDFWKAVRLIRTAYKRLER